MKKQHEEWLNEFLGNCEAMNRSPHTILNYRADLKKFIEWFEKTHTGDLNSAQAQTISHYKIYLSQGVLMPVKMAPKKRAPARPQNFWGKIKGILKKTFQKEEAPKALESIAEVPLKPLSTTDVSWPLSVGSRKRHLSSIKNFYDFLKEYHEGKKQGKRPLFKINPVKSKLHGIRLKETDVENTKLLTPLDWAKIQEFAWRPKEQLIVQLLYLGGLRLSELCSLRVSDFDKERECLTFVRKGGDVHTLFIQRAPQVFDLLNRYLASRPFDSDVLFLGRTQKHITSRAMYDFLMKLFRKSNCPTQGLTPHSFRKACATNLYSKTKDLLLVRDYLNHSDAKVTQTYIELQRETPQRAPQVQEQFMEK